MDEDTDPNASLISITGSLRTSSWLGSNSNKAGGKMCGKEDLILSISNCNQCPNHVKLALYKVKQISGFLFPIHKTGHNFYPDITQSLHVSFFRDCVLFLSPISFNSTLKSIRNSASQKSLWFQNAEMTEDMHSKTKWGKKIITSILQMCKII